MDAATSLNAVTLIQNSQISTENQDLKIQIENVKTISANTWENIHVEDTCKVIGIWEKIQCEDEPNAHRYDDNSHERHMNSGNKYDYNGNISAYHSDSRSILTEEAHVSFRDVSHDDYAAVPGLQQAHDQNYSCQPQSRCEQNYPPHDQSKVQCHICGRILHNYAYAQRHHHNLHNKQPMQLQVLCEEQPVKQLERCVICGLMFDARSELEVHVESIHSGYQLPLRCMLCPRRFIYKISHEEHYETEHRDIVGRITCPVCQELFMDIILLHNHIATQHECKVCCERLRSKRGLKRHFITQHARHLPFTCDICQECFKDETCRQTHNVEQSHVRCPQCDRMFKTTHGLRTHFQRTHTPAEPSQKDEHLSARCSASVTW